MAIINLKHFYSPAKLICSVFGHKIITTKKVTYHFREYKCSICGMEMTNNQEGQKIFLTPELKYMNKILNKLYDKKNKTL